MTYRSIHNWVVYHYGKADKCEKCKINGKKRYSWSNRTGKYLKDRKDWQKLCYSCHKLYDNKRNGYIAWNKGLRKERPTMICEWCGIRFTQNRVGQILCSSKCTAYRNGNIAKRKKGIITN